jgi:solute carrier family 25 (mitochondrial carnitine/acylcarnitine transporter), member 20/29
VEVNNTLIYFISHPLTPPADALTTALPQLDLSSFLAAVFSTNLADKLKYTPRTTLLIPHNSAFKRLGMLVSAYLLGASSKPDLERVIQHHVINSVEYAESLQTGSLRTYGTLEGSDLHLERPDSKDNKTMILTASGGWADMHSLLYTKNYLTQTGVIHEVSDIMIPRSVDITIGKLMSAAKSSTMISMMNRAGLDWIMNGTNPPDGSPWADMGLTGVGWTLLCPTDEAFKAFNLTELYGNKDWLTEIVLQHLVPAQEPSQAPRDVNLLEIVNNNRPLVLDDSTGYATLLSRKGISEGGVNGNVVFRKIDDEETVVGVEGARGKAGRRDWAHVTSWGRSTQGKGTGGVLLIDSVLVPYHPPWRELYGGPIAVFVIGMALIGAFFYGVRVVWKRDTTEATYEPVGGFGNADEDS